MEKLQKLTQKGDLEAYIREFNTLRGIAVEIATLDPGALLRYYQQGLKRDLRIMVAATRPDTLITAQANSRSMDVILTGRDAKDGPDPMDVSEGSANRNRFRKCNFCGIKGHIERECRKKQAGERKKGACFVCDQVGHFARECKVKNSILSAEEEE